MIDQLLKLKKKNNQFIKCAQIASSDGGSEGRDSDIWTEYGGEVEFFQPFVKILNLIFF